MMERGEAHGAGHSVLLTVSANQRENAKNKISRGQKPRALRISRGLFVPIYEGSRAEYRSPYQGTRARNRAPLQVKIV